MEAMEAGSRQSAVLPSISSIDAEKTRRDDTDFQRKHSAAAMVSPSFPYSNPPPPYTTHHAAAASAPPASLAGLISPPESRRTSGDEKEQKHPATRQSLPSIHEALASEQPMSYPHSTPSAPPPASQFFQPPPLPATSHPDPSRRHYSQDFSNKEPPASYSQQTERSPFMKPPPQVPPYSQAQQDPPRPTLPVHNNSKLPTLHPLRTEQSPVTGSRSFGGGYPPYSQQNSPAYEQNSQQQAGPVQQQQQQPFGYNHPYPPAPYPYSAPPPPPPPSQANPPYPPSAPAYSAPAGYPPAWRSDGAEVRRAEENKRAGRHAGPTLYGESVKRHLDSFDFEASLNEIAEGSGRLNDFLRVYGQRAHQAQRSGPAPGSTPTINEVDDLMKQGQRIIDSLARIREVVLTTQQAHLAEQAQDPRYKATSNGYEPDESHHSYGEDPKGGGGFAGSDPKKRRGRAAPPGRCHSCNRAETPEWRRGPDGARTLCNACGLHYAKLTRKMGANKAPIGSSNLRPKSLGPGSPPA